ISAGYPPSRAAATRASSDPVLPHHSPGVSPGSGIMALTRTSRLTGTAVHTIGAVKPPIDWATSTTSRRLPMAAVTRPAYSGSPADLSSPGNSTAIASWPRASSRGTTRDQNDAAPPAPGISTNVLTGNSLVLVVRRYDARGRRHSPAAGITGRRDPAVGKSARPVWS